MKVAKIHGFGKSAYAGLPTKILLVMRLTTFLMLAACLHVQARGYSQGSITLSVKDAPIAKVFQAIETQSGYHFFYDYALLQQAVKVSVEVKKATLDQVLAICFRNQPFTYSIQGKLIVVKEKAPAAPTDAEAPPDEVSGTIRNEDGALLAGATIEIIKLNLKAIANEKGEFLFREIPNGKYLVEITYIGYQKFQEEINLENNEIKLSVSLKHLLNSLDEVQIIAYGSTTQRLSTGDITMVKSEDIAKQPVGNPLLALEGRVPGMNITENTGVPGGGITIRVQGQNSLTAGSDPLYIVDGVPYPSQSLMNISGSYGILGSNGSTNNYDPGGGGNPLTFINPADIASISVLKDADATAIYGSRGSNGVVLITTKKGKVGPTTSDINAQEGWGKVTRMLPLMNTRQYLQMRHEAFANDVLTPSATDYDVNGTWDTTRNTNWQKVLLGGVAHYTDAQASVSGGSENTTFLFGAGYHKETTVFPGDAGDGKGSVHFNISHFSADRRFHLQLTGSYMFDKNKLPGTDLTNMAVQLAPDAPSLYNKDGSLNWAPLPSGTSTWFNPLSFLYNMYTLKTNNLVSNVQMSYELLSGLAVSSNFGYNNIETNELNINPLIGIAPDLRPYSSRVSVFGTETVGTWTVEPQVKYKRAILGGTLDVLVGTTFLQTTGNAQQLLGQGYSSDAEMQSLAAAATVSVYQTNTSAYHYNAFFGRVGYNWQNRYILDVSGRRDGSSRFGPDNLLHNFGSVGAAWLFSNESFFKKSSFLSFGKLRASYGTTGNDQIGNYQYLNLYSTVYVPIAYQNTAGILPAGLANPNLQWEETRKLEVGTDLAFAHERIVLSMSYYHNRSSNLLQPYALPAITGFGSVIENFSATVQNAGLEATLNVKLLATKKFRWETSINLTVPKNKLVSFPGLTESSYAQTYTIGQPVTSKRVLTSLGVDPSTGIYIFKDNHGSPTSNPDYSTDLTSVVNIDPKFFGGWQNSFHYEDLQLDFLFQFVKQTSGLNYALGNQPGYFYSGSYSSVIANQPTYVLGRWQKLGDKTDVQKYTTQYSNPGSDASSSSTLATSDASFIRLKNLSLSWTLPKKWVSIVHFQDCRIFVLGQNLLTITRFKGVDPESQSVYSMPPTRVITFGLHFGIQ